MNRPLSDIYIERGQLQERIAQQRRHLVKSVQPIAHALQRADSGYAYVQRGVHLARQYPEVVAVVALLLCFKNPRLCLRWFNRAFLTWRAFKTWRHTLQNAWRPVSSWLRAKWRA